jgi:hypothetical protein
MLRHASSYFRRFVGGKILKVLDGLLVSAASSLVLMLIELV